MKGTWGIEGSKKINLAIFLKQLTSTQKLADDHHSYLPCCISLCDENNKKNGIDF